jgi:hypothetical protein
MMTPAGPSLGAESFSCPHCGAFAQQSWFRGFLVNFERGVKPQITEYDLASSRTTRSGKESTTR